MKKERAKSYLFDVRLAEYELQESAVLQRGEMWQLKVGIDLIFNLFQFVQCDGSMKYYTIQVLLNGSHYIS